MVEQQKVQTRDRIFGGIFDSETHVKDDYNKIVLHPSLIDLLGCLLKVAASIFSVVGMVTSD
jgi:hypothetical protein